MSPVCGSHPNTWITSNILVGSGSSHEPTCHFVLVMCKHKIKYHSSKAWKYKLINEINQFFYIIHWIEVIQLTLPTENLNAQVEPNIRKLESKNSIGKVDI